MRLLAILLVLLPAAAWAEGNYVSPSGCGVYWTAPTKNTDGSALTNLKEFRVYIAATPPADWNAAIRGGLAPRYTATATTPAPPIGQQYRQDCRDLAGGQWYVVLTAVNLAGVQSGASIQSPFVFVVTVPDTVTDTTVGP